MAAAVDASSLKVCDITQCVICLETFKVPKALPCIHTFCLQCLDNYCEEQEEEQVACPLCRKVFTIPPGGNVNLPNNFFILQLLQVKQLSGATENEATRNWRKCELCSCTETETVAVSYCVECDKRICDQCSDIHQKTRMFAAHQVVRKANVPSAQEEATLSVNYCDKHPNEQVRLYCNDCKIVTCHICFVNGHMKHELIDVKESAEKFRGQLNDDVDIVSACALKKSENVKQLKIATSVFMEKIAAAQSEISQRCEELVSLIQLQQKELIDELNVFKEKTLKKFRIATDEIERQFVITESFKQYCLELMNKGTACDISHAANDLHARAVELVKTRRVPKYRHLSKVNVTFKPHLPTTTDSADNLIGQLVCQGYCTKNARKFALTQFLESPRVLHVGSGCCYAISGMTVLGGEVFVLNDWDRVNVCTSDDFTWTRVLEITPTYPKRFAEIISCSHYNCLYVSDDKLRNIYKYDLTNDITTTWPVGGRCFRLSLTKCHNILVALNDTNLIREYTTDGSLVRQISLDKSISDLWCCVQMSTGNLVVICNLDRRGRVCIVDQSGQIIQSYGGSNASDDEQTYNPCHLAIDIHDNVLVADAGIIGSVELLSPTLAYLGDIVIPGHQLIYPCSLHFDEVNHRLYIGEGEYDNSEDDGGGRMFVLEINDDN